jgi:putative adenylate-forming enzyme
MNKAQMMANFGAMNTVGFTSDDAFMFAEDAEYRRDFTENYRGVTVGLSSGTSGSRGIYLASPAERELWAGAILGKMVPDMLWRKHRVALFLRAGSTLYESVNSKRLQFQFFDLAEPMEKHLVDLNKFKPDIIFAPGQVLKLLTQEADHLVFAPKRVIACAEVLYDDAAQAVRDTWGVEPEHIYQATEGFLGCTQKGVFQLNEDLVHVEPLWLDDEKTRFKPLITDFRRVSQPIIRYELDDVLAINPESNTIFREIQRVEGRCDDILEARTLSGVIVPLYPDFLVRAVLFQSDVDRFQIIQHHVDSLTIQVSQEDRHVITNVLLRFYESKQLLLPRIVYEDLVYDPLNKQRRVSKIKRIHP